MTARTWNSRHPSAAESGFTLIEALIVVVLLGVVVTITAMGLQSVKEKTGLEAAAQSIKALFDEAPGEAIQRNTQMVVRYVSSGRRFELVDPTDSSVVDTVRLEDSIVFEGTAPTSWSAWNGDPAVICDELGRLVDPSTGSQMMAPVAFQITLRAMNDGRVKPKYRYLVQVFPVWSCRVTKIRVDS